MKQRSRRKRLAIWLVASAVALPFAGYGLSNLFLISPKGRAYVSSRIAARIQLDTSVQGTTWSPWGGLTVYGLRIEQPKELREAFSKPLLSVQSLRIKPVWSQLLKKRLDVKGIDLVKPDFTLPIELLAMIPATPPDNELTTNPPPDLAINQPPPQAVSPLPAPPAVVPDPSEPPPTPPQPTSTKFEAPPQVTAPTTFVSLTDARIRIVTTMTESPLYQVTGLNGKIPMGGKKTQTSLVAEAISTLGTRIADDMKIPIDWNPPALTSNPIDGKIFGIDATCGVQLILTQGLPIRIVAAIPEQKDKEIKAGEATGLRFEAIAGQGAFQGYLTYPASWQGQALIRSSSIEARHLGNQTHFDTGHGFFVFQNGALRCVDGRLSGEQISILGNATLLTDGRGAANVRFVASTETLAAFSSFTDPTGSPPYFTPLNTPQRAALDLQLFGRLGDFSYKPHPKAAPIQIR